MLDFHNDRLDHNLLARHIQCVDQCLYFVHKLRWSEDHDRLGMRFRYKANPSNHVADRHFAVRPHTAARPGTRPGRRILVLICLIRPGIAATAIRFIHL